MPYASIAELPDPVKIRYSDRCQEVFRKTFNNAMSSRTGGGAASEESAFKIAHTAAGNCKDAGKSKRSPLAMTDMTVKFAEGSDTIIEGYGVPFGLDLDGQEFSAETDRCHNWFPKGGRPILADHGFNSKIKMAPIGVELSTTTDDVGDFVRAELDKSHKYYEAVAKLVRDRKYGWSSGAPDHKVKIAKGGHIDLWPVVEYSLTTTPAKPNTVAFAMKSAQVMELLEDSDVEIPEALIETTHEGDSEPETHAEQAERVLASLKAWVERMEERSEARVKSGRELSKANIETLRDAHRIIGELLERADKPSKDEAEAAKSYAEFLRLEATQLGATPD